MVLLWINKKYAEHRKLWTSLKGIVYKDTRPDILILTEKEHNELVNSPSGTMYFNKLQKVTTNHNIIVASSI